MCLYKPRTGDYKHERDRLDGNYGKLEAESSPSYYDSCYLVQQVILVHKFKRIIPAPLPFLKRLEKSGFYVKSQNSWML
jgi:hypothetical protein